LSRSSFNQISSRVDWYTPDERTDRPSLGAVHGTSATLLVDGGASVQHLGAFVAQLTTRGRPPIVAIALTHWHWDHSFGSAAVDAPVIAHIETARELATQASYSWTDEALDERVRDGREIEFCAEMLRLEWGGDRTGLRIVTPTVTFESEHVVDLGGVRAVIRHVGGDHARDSSVIYVPEDRVLFLGDCLYRRLYAVEPLRTAVGVLNLVSALTAFEPEIVIGGHEDRPSGAREYAACLAKLKAAAELVARQGEAARDAMASDDSELQELIGSLLTGTRLSVGLYKP
jgi:glyoxylase-like metal-dependent hydrolase (beta-lactamase superfamily II)